MPDAPASYFLTYLTGVEAFSAGPAVRLAAREVAHD